jgi:predicted permease
LAAELKSHLDHRIDDLVAGGMSREDAARTARMEFGALEAYKEQCRDSQGFSWARLTHGLYGDVKLSARRLTAAPLFLLFAVLSLGIGLAVTVASYAVIEAIFWKPLGIADQGRVAVVAVPSRGQWVWREQHSRADFDRLRRDARVFSGLAAATGFDQTLTTQSRIVHASGQAVSGGYFQLLGVRPMLGRTIQPADDAESAAVVVISERLWRTLFGADAAVIGRVVRLGNHPFDVVGVAPRSFDGITYGYGGTDVWIPLEARARFASAPPAPGDLERRELSVLGRLADGHSVRSAAQAVAGIARGDRRWSVRTVSRRDNTEGTPFGVLLLVIVSLVLLVACTNLANLMLARGTLRQHDYAVRRALGASRWRLVRELLVESSVIAVLGAAAAAALTRVLMNVFPVGLPDNGSTFVIDPAISPTAVAVAACGLLFALLTFGLEPAVQLTRRTVTSDLASESGSVGVPRARRQRTLIRWQVAICTCFFLVTALVAKVIVQASRHDSGIDLDRLAVARVAGAEDWDERRTRPVLDGVLAAARQERGIESVAVTTGFPFGIASGSAALRTPDKPFTEGRLEQITDTVIAATPDIFQTLGVPIVAGRAFGARDDAASESVAIVSETTARRLFGTRDAIGRQLLVQRGRRPVTTVTVIGVTADTDGGRLMSRYATFGTMYVPFAQHFESRLFLVARTSGDPAAAATSLQVALRKAAPELAAQSAGPADTFLAEGYLLARVAGVGAGLLGGLALLLAMVGLYGVQSQIVAHRTREVGVRVALGATARHIQRLVMAEGFAPVLQGVALGLALGIVARLAFRVLLGVPLDPTESIALVLAPIPLGIAAFVACRIPAHRASRVDPIVALRHL